MTDYTQTLKECGLKVTFQRTHILENIEEHGHMSIDDIYIKIVQIHPSISLATIYKNIILMVENAVLVEVPIEGKKSKYELAKSDHIHLVCTECGEVEDKPHNESADALFSSMTKSENFTLQKQQINLYGVCMHCQQAIAS